MVLPTRSLGKLLCTRAGRPEIVTAGVLGGLLGFAPGFLLVSDVAGGLRLAPALLLAGLAAALVLRVHLGFFALVVVAAKALAVVLSPLRHRLGELVVDAMTPLFGWLRDLPLVAWCGPAQYATVGGLLLGIGFGAAAGTAAWRGLQRLRRRVASLEQGSERYAGLTGRRAVRWLGWLALGAVLKHGRWTELAEQKPGRVPRPRPLGVAAAAALALGVGWMHGQLVAPELRRAVQAGLEHCNGATVDVGAAELDLLAGVARLEGLAIADPEALDQDLLRAERLVLALDTGALLRRRFVVDEITAVGAETGAKRATPGELLAAPAAPPPPVPGAPKERSLEDWVAAAERWHGRLQQIAHWIDVLARHAPAAGGGAPEPGARSAGPAEVEPPAAASLAAAAAEPPAVAERYPAVLIREIRIEGIRCPWLEDGDLLDLRAASVSSHPDRVAEPMELTLSARSGAWRVVLRREPGRRELHAEVQCGRRPVDATLAALGVIDPPLRGGTLEARLAGRLAPHSDLGVEVALSLAVTARDTTLALPGAPPAVLAELPVAIALRGPLARPRLRLDDEALTHALLAAGQRRLAAAVEEHAARLLAEHAASPLAESLARDPAAALREAERQAEAARRQAEEAAKRRAAEELEQRLPGGLKGLWPKRD